MGPLAGDYFTNGSMIAAAQNGPWVYFFTGGLNILLIVLVVLSIGYSFWNNMLQKDQPVADELNLGLDK